MTGCACGEWRWCWRLHPVSLLEKFRRVAAAMGRRFAVIEKRPDYFETMRRELRQFGFNAVVDFDDLQFYWSAEHDDG